VVTIGLGVDDGRDEFVGIPFRSLPKLTDVGNLDGIVVFVNEPHVIATKYPAFLILHNPPPIREKLKAFAVEGAKGRTLIVTSRYAGGLWSKYLKIDASALAVVYPFAEPCFGAQSRLRNSGGTTRILFAGRLSPEKGIYTLLETLHIDIISQDLKLTFTVTTAGADKSQGKIIEQLVGAHPGIDVVAARKTPAKMAFLMAEHDIVVMPSNSQYWHETFGIVSVEAQHSGCWVVASDDGGLPETNCGGVVLVKPGNAEALAWGIREAMSNGPLSAETRQDASTKFTVGQSVDSLLKVLLKPKMIEIEPLEELIRVPLGSDSRLSRPRISSDGS
jgi:glycosyltransferase involved in cell wall biosynthesis